MHIFHFMINNEMLESIKLLKYKLNFKNINKTIIYILNFYKFSTALYNLTNNHFSKKPENAGRIINIKLNINEGFYRLLKSIHSKKNVFSIAQILRSLIDFFIEGVNKFGSIEGFVVKLRKLNKDKYKKNIYEEFKKKMAHIYKIFIINIIIIKEFIKYIYKISTS